MAIRGKLTSPTIVAASASVFLFCPPVWGQSVNTTPSCFSEEELARQETERTENAEAGRKESRARRQDARDMRELAQELRQAAEELRSDQLETEARTVIAMSGTVVDGACELIRIGTPAAPTERVCASWQFGRDLGGAYNSVDEGKYLEATTNFAKASAAGGVAINGGDLTRAVTSGSEATMQTALAGQQGANGEFLSTADSVVGSVTAKVDVLLTGPWSDQATKQQVKLANDRLKGTVGAYRAFRQTFVLASELDRSVDVAVSGRQKLLDAAANLERAAEEMDEKADDAIPAEDLQNPFEGLSTGAGSARLTCDDARPGDQSETEASENAPNIDLDGLMARLDQNAFDMRVQNEIDGDRLIDSVNSGELAMAQNRAQQTQKSINSAAFGQTMQTLSYAALDLGNSVNSPNRCAALSAALSDVRGVIAETQQMKANGYAFQGAADMHIENHRLMENDLQNSLNREC